MVALVEDANPGREGTGNGNLRDPLQLLSRELSMETKPIKDQIAALGGKLNALRGHL